MTANEDTEWLRWTDEAILEELREQRLEYVALLANRRGLHLAYAKERCRLLDRRGFIERTTDEVTYRITEKGEDYLDNGADETIGNAPDDRVALQLKE